MNFLTKLKSFLLIAVVLISSSVYASETLKEDPVQVAKSFYTLYMDYYFEMVPPDSADYVAMMDKYITPRFNKEIQLAKICERKSDPVCAIDGVEPQLGYVYILRAQDAYDDWKTIKVQLVKKDISRSSVEVYLGGVQEKAHIIMVTLVKNKDQWMIDNVSDVRPAPYRFQ